MPARKTGNTTAEHRITALRNSFTHLLSGDPSDAFREVEEEAMEKVSEIFPGASAWMTRAALRLSTGFVTSMPDLAARVIPAHQQVLEAYVWGAPRSPEEAEGFGSFWLFEASNAQLDAFEGSALDAISPCFLVNPFRKMAARSWLRLQALYLDPRRIGDLIALWDDHRRISDEPFPIPDWMVADPSAAALTAIRPEAGLH